MKHGIESFFIKNAYNHKIIGVLCFSRYYCILHFDDYFRSFQFIFTKKLIFTKISTDFVL